MLNTLSRIAKFTLYVLRLAWKIADQFFTDAYENLYISLPIYAIGIVVGLRLDPNGLGAYWGGIGLFFFWSILVGGERLWKLVQSIRSGDLQARLRVARLSRKPGKTRLDSEVSDEEEWIESDFSKQASGFEDRE